MPKPSWMEVASREAKAQGPRGRRNDAIIGTSKVEGISAIRRVQRASVFVSRLDPTLDVKLLKSHIVKNVGFDVNVEKLKAKFNTYSSFHITAVCPDPQKLLAPDLWPEDTYVRWFYEKKNDGNIQPEDTT